MYVQVSITVIIFVYEKITIKNYTKCFIFVSFYAAMTLFYSMSVYTFWEMCTVGLMNVPVPITLTLALTFLTGQTDEAAEVEVHQDQMEPSGAGHHHPQLECPVRLHQEDVTRQQGPGILSKQQGPVSNHWP